MKKKKRVRIGGRKKGDLKYDARNEETDERNNRGKDRNMLGSYSINFFNDNSIIGNAGFVWVPFPFGC